MDPRILFTTEKECLDAGAGLLGCYLERAKSRKHCKDYIRKMKAYKKHMVMHNHNYISINQRTRGKYRYSVLADCVEGFAKSGYRFTVESTQAMENWLKDVSHKSNCIFSGDLAVPSANFETLEDAEKFALLLLSLTVYNCHEEDRVSKVS